VGAVEQGADRALAVFLLERGAHADEVFAAGDEQCRHAAGLGSEAVRDGEIEVDWMAAVIECRRRLAGDGDRMLGVDGEAGLEVGRQHAREAERLARDGAVEHVDHIDHAAHLVAQAGGGARLHQVRGRYADAEHEAGDDDADQAEGETGELGADAPVGGIDGLLAHALSGYMHMEGSIIM
jgi:hypothetical protein